MAVMPGVAHRDANPQPGQLPSGQRHLAVTVWADWLMLRSPTVPRCQQPPAFYRGISAHVPEHRPVAPPSFCIAPFRLLFPSACLFRRSAGTPPSVPIARLTGKVSGPLRRVVRRRQIAPRIIARILPRFLAATLLWLVSCILWLCLRIGVGVGVGVGVSIVAVVIVGRHRLYQVVRHRLHQVGDANQRYDAPSPAVFQLHVAAMLDSSDSCNPSALA